MKPSHTDVLCTQCGLCCDGSLFADVELAGARETSGLEAMGLEIEDDDAGRGLLVQPCAALKGTRCGIYTHRPECCRTFECGLLQAVRRGAVTVERAGKHIAEVIRKIGQIRALARDLGHHTENVPLKERCAEALALANDLGVRPWQEPKRAELETAMADVEKLIQKRFLDRNKRAWRAIGKTSRP